MIHFLQQLWSWYCIGSAIVGLATPLLAILTPKPSDEEDAKLVYRS